MLRSSKRRQAKELKKRLEKMSVSEVQEFITQIYVDGVNATMLLHRDALKEIYGFGDARYNRVHEYISDKLINRKEDTSKLEGINNSENSTAI